MAIKAPLYKKEIFMIQKYDLHLAVAALLVFFSGSACNAEPPVRISFTGDIIMHIPVKTAAKQNSIIDKEQKQSLNNSGFDFLFKNIKNHLKKSDIVQETLSFQLPPYTSKPRIFNCPPRVLDALKDTGFTMVTLANNHMLDQGPKGVTSTISHVEKAGLEYIGADRTETDARRGRILRKRDIRIGFLAYTGVSNYPIGKSGKKPYHINWFYHKEKVKKDIAAIKKECDYLIMTVHTGVEYALTPAAEDKKLMKEYAETGVDLIIGHHPHIIQPVERYACSDGRRAHIFYSLGNFISNQSSTHRLRNSRLKTSTRDSIIVTCLLESKDGKVIPGFEVTPIMTYNGRDRKTWKRTIQTWTIDDFRAHHKKTLAGKAGNYPLKKTLKSLESRVAALHHIINGAGSHKDITITSGKNRTAN